MNDAIKTLQEAGGKAELGKVERKDRLGRKALTSWHDPAVLRQIKTICYEREMTSQAFIAECLNLGFAKYKKGQIA